MTGTIKKTTVNYNLRIPIFDAPGWGREVERNFDIIDAMMFAISGFTNVAGVWNNGTLYNVNDRVVDQTNNTIWRCVITHTSAVTGTFAQDRASRPTFWTVVNTTVSNKGTWQPNTEYVYNDFVMIDNRIGVVVAQSYTSSNSFDTDVANNNIIVLIDIRQWITQAQTNATNAANSAASAQTSATNAAGSANAASTSATNALGSANAAATSASAASGSATNAATSATTASNKATEAFNNATFAETQAASATASRNAAANSATAAATSATNASTSATTASTKAGEAATSATSAAASATAANTSKTDAATSASAADASKTAAAGSATAAATSASNASGSATTATNKASEAQASASAANTAKGQAQDAQASAANSASTAVAARDTAVSAKDTAVSAQTGAVAARNSANEWANAPEDAPVDDGTHQGFSAYHWSRKAQQAAGGGLQSIRSSTLFVDNTDPQNPLINLAFTPINKAGDTQIAVMTSTQTVVAPSNAGPAYTYTLVTTGTNFQRINTPSDATGLTINAPLNNAAYVLSLLVTTTTAKKPITLSGFAAVVGKFSDNNVPHLIYVVKYPALAYAIITPLEATP